MCDGDCLLGRYPEYLQGPSVLKLRMMVLQLVTCQMVLQRGKWDGPLLGPFQSPALESCVTGMVLWELSASPGLVLLPHCD
jgi:hypothetical protein